MDDFVLVAAAATLAGVSQETIRRWAHAGKVRRRRRGRHVEYHRLDVLSVAGRAPPDPAQAELEQLRVTLEQTEHERDQAVERARRRQDKLNNFQRRWTQRLESERQVRADLEATLQVVQQQLTAAQASNQRASDLAAALRTLVEELLADVRQSRGVGQVNVERYEQRLDELRHTYQRE
jgi:hypothetical protein